MFTAAKKYHELEMERKIVENKNIEILKIKMNWQLI